MTLLFSLSLSAQKIVFAEAYDIKNNPFDSKLPNAKILEDSVSRNRLMIVSGGKDITFYLMDPNWKLLKKFSKPFSKETVLKDNFFKILKFSGSSDKWIFIGSDYARFTRETVDFAAQTHLVQPDILPDQQGIARFFTDENANYIMYYTKGKDIRIAGFNEELKPKTIMLMISTNLPAGKSSKYGNDDIYNSLELMNEAFADDAYYTRKKAHFYVLKNAYALLLFGDEPLAELSLFDKTTGRRIKSKLYSVEDLVGVKAKDFNAAGLLFRDKLYVLAAHKSGGVLAAFDTATGKVAFSKNYSEKDDLDFSYGPVMYETLPGTFSTAVLKEKVEPISMDKFSKEMYKHSCAITAKETKNGVVISLANFDQKVLAAATAPSRISMNTMTSGDWYKSAAAGILFEPGTLTPSKKKINWNELNKSEATGSYSKVKPVSGGGGVDETDSKKAYTMKVQFIEDRSYVIYYFEGQLKVRETKYNQRFPSMFGVD